jgi:acyl-CoA hydrolase
MRVVSRTALRDRFSALPGESPRVVASGNFAAPFETLAVLDESAAAYRLFMLNAPPGIPVRDGVVLETPFVGAGMRDQPGLDYIPSRLSLVPLLFTTTRPPDVVILHTSTPRDGTVSLGCEVNILPAAVEAVRDRGGIVVAQLNPQMPYTYGDGQLSTEAIDIAWEVDAPIPVPAVRETDETAKVIGERVAHLVPDGATLQLGIGGVPDATLAALTHRRGLRLWSEMFSDGLLALDEAGALDVDVPITASFCFGSKELYDFVDRNPRVRVKRTEKVNDPGGISRQVALVSVNTALQIDLFAQANASRRGHRIYSGFGGQTDFIVGALHSKGGRAVIALPSWHPKANVSTVVPLLSGPVTSFQHSHIVSERGTATIWGSDQREQARNICENVAHPDARDGLREAADELGLRF